MEVKKKIKKASLKPLPIPNPILGLDKKKEKRDRAYLERLIPKEFK